MSSKLDDFALPFLYQLCRHAIASHIIKYYVQRKGRIDADRVEEKIPWQRLKDTASQLPNAKNIFPTFTQSNQLCGNKIS